VFEQSILLHQDAKRSRNFLASFSAEIAIITLALLVPLAYTDHLPAFHWKDILMIPPKPAPEPIPVHAAPSRATNSVLAEPVARRMFHYVPITAANPASAPVNFAPEAPPSLGVESGVDAVRSNRVLPIAPPVLPPPPKPRAHANATSAPIPVGGMVQMAKLLRMVKPEYPALAKAARISGAVHLMATIAKDGTIRNLQLVSGHPILARAAMEAVAQWVYKPTLLDGKPVEVIAPIEVSFSLGTGS
jgi:periplasmic protein TonB